MSKIANIYGRRILDSRGKPTVEVKITTDKGATAIDSVPSGTSTGTKEAALVDVEKACANINKIIAGELKGENVEEQEKIDKKMIELDGTENKNRLGANAVLGVSLAVARAAALSTEIPLYRYINQLFRRISSLEIEPQIPTPMMVMLCGGKHAVTTGFEGEYETGKGNNLSIQEFSVLGELADGIKIWQELEKLLRVKKIETTIGLEGAFAPQQTNEEALVLLKEAIKNVASNLQGEIRLGLDIAGSYCQLSNQQILALFKKFQLYSLEDPFGEEDWERFGQLKLELEELKIPFLLIGDDLFATHKKLLEKGINHLVANGVIIKPNQVGTLSEVLEVMKIAYQAQYTCIVSHRSGETTDTFIADLAVGTAAKYLKSGAPIPTERLLKYRRLKEIEGEL